MKEAFITNRFSAKSKGLLAKIVDITEAYAADGYDLSLRQLFYLLTGTAVFEKTEKNYKNLGNLVSNGRLAGVIDWDTIRDRGRITCHGVHCESVPEVVASMKHGFRVDMWNRQPCYVEVFCEKQSLEGVLEPVCAELDVPFSSNKGYSSSSAYYEASKRYLSAALANKELHVLYFGDHDPSGIDMTRDIDDRFNLFISSAMESQIFNEEELASIDPRPHELHRMALNMDQVRSMHLQSSPTKLKDTRAAGYIAKYGRESFELAAIEPRTLAKLVRDAVEGLVDQTAWDEDKARENKGRDNLQTFADTYGVTPEKPYDVQDYTREERPNE